DRYFFSRNNPQQEWATTRRQRHGARRPAASRSRRRGALPWRMDPFVQVTLEAVARLRRPGVLRYVQVIGAVTPRHAKRPGAARRVRKPGNIDRGDDAGGEQLVLEHVALSPLFETHQAGYCGMRGRGELPPPADPDVAGLVRPARVEQRDIRPDRRHEDEVALHFPVFSFLHEVGTTDAGK